MQVRLTGIVEAVGTRTASLMSGLHVPAIEDTTKVNYQSQADRKYNPGTDGTGTDVGPFLHPVWAGPLQARIWQRKKPSRQSS